RAKIDFLLMNSSALSGPNWKQMLFSSLEFILIFFPIVMIGYFFIERSRSSAVLSFLILASLIFYSWFRFSYLFLMLFSILINYGLAFGSSPSKPKLTFAIIFNLALLFYFKYMGFFLESVNVAFGSNFQSENIALP